MSDDNVNKLILACADPEGPLYGSDIVPWIGDLIEDRESLKRMNETLSAGIRAVRELINHSTGVDRLVSVDGVVDWESLQRFGFNQEWLVAFNIAEDALK